ncbi:hypothetical protein SERLA73DRAFT_143722, partial [Serpula lacrymans var. lacrymans S7.3]
SPGTTSSKVLVEGGTGRRAAAAALGRAFVSNADINALARPEGLDGGFAAFSNP